ncbi:MAG TPA: RecX family transcriptional regulator [Candidatus Cloacimonas sp.]|mgnify:CR=1 FL=1|nr:RecX family transcriptional regulator [Candidatus Cloacimonas sp.]
MHLHLTKTSERDRHTLLILDNLPRGVLPDRILLAFFSYPYSGEIDAHQAAELLSILENQARQQLLKYLAEREHSSLQCREYLKRKSYPDDLVNRLIIEFTDRKYIDDERFAQLLIYSLIERGKSKSHIIQKLKENELPASVWETILASSFDPVQNSENLYEQVLKLRLRYGELPEYKQKDKVFASLMRKGYDLDDIHAAWQKSKK